MPTRLTTRVLLKLAVLAPLAAPPVSAQPLPDRVQTVAGWRISSGDSGDGGYVARLTHRGPGFFYNHEIEYWRGNGGVVMLDEFRRGRCQGTGLNAIVPFAQGMSRRAFDQRLASYLRECPLPRAGAAAMRASLARAWPVFLRHARRQRAALHAEAARIMRGD